MQKNKKSKKERLEKLHMILDRPSRRDLHPEDEKYLQALGRRLESSSKESILHIHRISEEKQEKEADLLKPRVTIHHKEEKESVVRVKQEEPEGRKESLFEDENLYEVEKVEVKGPEFLEVKPKEAAKEEEKIPAEKPAEELESEITKKTKEDVSEEQLPEWEPVDIKKTETKVEETKERKSESKDELPLPVEEKTEFKEEEFFEEELDLGEEKTPPIEKEEEIDVFKGISSIDQKTAKLLFGNGITSIGVLSDTPIKKLTKIKGIKRKLAKRIKEEVNQLAKETDEDYSFVEGEDTGEWETKESNEKTSEQILKDNPLIEETGEEWDFYEEDEIPGQKVKEVKGYRYEDYTLYKKEMETSSGKKQTVHFFSKAEPDDGEPVELPSGFEVKVNKKTGVPYLRKKIRKNRDS